MINMNSEIIGWLGSLFVLLSFIPKSIRKIRFINVIGCILWIIYGFITKAPSVYVMNFLVMALNVFHLVKDRSELLTD